jgi:hypothetical protein
MQHIIQKGFLFHLNSPHPGKTDTQPPSITITTVETPLLNLPFVRLSNNDDELLVASDEQCNEYFNFNEGADESVCVSPLNNKTKQANFSFHWVIKYSYNVSFHRVIKYSYNEATSSTASCATQHVEEEFENFSVDGYSKDDFKKALVDLQHHVENHEIKFENLNNKIPSTESPFDEDSDAGTFIIADSAIDAAQEAVLDIFPEGVDNETIELTDQNDASLLTMQSQLQY